MVQYPGPFPPFLSSALERYASALGDRIDVVSLCGVEKENMHCTGFYASCISHSPMWHTNALFDGNLWLSGRWPDSFVVCSTR